MTYYAGHLDEAQPLARTLGTAGPDFRRGHHAPWRHRGAAAETPLTAHTMERRLAYDQGRYARYEPPPLGRARIAAALGDRERAVELLRGSLARGHWYTWLDLRAVPEFESLRGYAPFDELVRPKE